MGSSFDDVIREHLELKRRNSSLEASLPLASYLDDGGVFDGERGEGAAYDTAEWTGRRRRTETFLESLEDVWSAGPVFDWGDGKGS